jgi:hypothetical protein
MAIRVGCQTWDDEMVPGACHLSPGNQGSAIEQKNGHVKTCLHLRVNENANLKKQ